MDKRREPRYDLRSKSSKTRKMLRCPKVQGKSILHCLLLGRLEGILIFIMLRRKHLLKFNRVNNW